MYQLILSEEQKEWLLRELEAIHPGIKTPNRTEHVSPEARKIMANSLRLKLDKAIKLA